MIRGVFMFRTNGMPRCHGWQRAAMFSVDKDVLGRAMQGAYCRDERSGFLFPTNPKYVHPGFGILRRSNCAIHGFACTQCRGAPAGNRFQTFPKYAHPCAQWQRAAMFIACTPMTCRGSRLLVILLDNEKQC